MTITKLGAISCDTWYKIIAALAVLGRAAVIGSSAHLLSLNLLINLFLQ